LDSTAKRSSYTQRLLERGTGSVAFIGGVGIFIIAGAIVVDIFMRVTFNSPILGVDDLSIYILAVVVSSFFPACLVREKFVTIRFLGRALGPGYALWLEVFGAFCTLAIFIILSWKILIYTLDVTRNGMGTIVLQLPQAPWWWAVTVIFFLCIPVQSIVLFNKFLKALNGRPVPVKEPAGSPPAGNKGSVTRLD
jgi:TRAP-type C4-dicarboxylate transport system permease small subunit